MRTLPFHLHILIQAATSTHAGRLTDKQDPGQYLVMPKVKTLHSIPHFQVQTLPVYTISIHCKPAYSVLLRASCSIATDIQLCRMKRCSYSTLHEGCNINFSRNCSPSTRPIHRYRTDPYLYLLLFQEY
jgi:hypothetical protein